MNTYNKKTLNGRGNRSIVSRLLKPVFVVKRNPSAKNDYVNMITSRTYSQVRLVN